jgi:hypothetical protein
VKKFTIFLFVLLNSFYISNAQNLTQTIRGKIVDEDSKSPLIGANVIILGTNPLRGAITDIQGNYRFDNVSLGRVDIQLRYIGYEEKTISNVLVSSGKEVILDLELKETVIKMEEVVVVGRKRKGEVQNEMAIISSRSFSVEETKRYAGAMQDPSRMVSAYAGVTSDPSGNNDIVVLGNSPKGILWRMEGVEIPNPNHFANEGATGGPINALNSELLANSDFYTGAFSPEYGDVLSGVFDMKMRTGNNEKYEYSFGLGVLGTDITAEGPVNKKQGGSFLFNYRYSSLSLLHEAGIVDFEGIPKYQDAAFKVVLPTKKAGTLSLFGLGGISSIFESEKESEESERIVEKVDFGARLGVIGLIHQLPITQNSFLKVTVSASDNGSTYDALKADMSDNFNYQGNGSWEKSSLRSSVLFNSKLNSRHRIVTGLKYTRHFYNMEERFVNDDYNRVETGIDMHKSAGDLQGYVSWKFRLTDNFTWVGGFHSMYFDLNKEFVIEPRLALRWQFSPMQSFNLGFGQHSKTESIITYYTNIYSPDGTFTTPNSGLGISKARHYVLGHEFRISKNLNSKLEFYYQDLFNIPVENMDTSSFSTLNSDEGYVDKALINAGKGSNIGVEYTLERYFAHNFYFLLTASLYDSKYKAKENKIRNTKYNGNYAANFLIGKEFKIGKESKSNSIGVNAKFVFNGGRRYIPVDLPASVANGETVHDYSRAWVNKLDDVKQLNFSITYRVNRPKASHEIIVDVINATNENARNWEYYNKYTQKLDYYRQLNMIPNIMYRVHF